MLKTLLATAALGLALVATQPAAAQQFGRANAPATQQGGGLSAQQFLLGTWSLESAEGMTVATYLPNGMVNGVVYLRGRPQPLPFQGSWSVRPLGVGHFELTLTAFGKRASDRLRVMPDGNLYSEQSRAVAYRVY